MNYILTNSTLTFFANSKVYSIHKASVSDNVWKAALIHARDKNLGELIKICDVAEGLVNYAGAGAVSVKDGVVYYKDQSIDSYVARKMLQFMREDLPFKPLARFIERLMKNQSYRVREQLYGFLEHGNMPIDDDGYFLAYKKVRSDYMDIYSGKFSNKIGDVCEMDRFDVNDDPTMTCSAGLHVCSYDYLPHFGCDASSTVMVVRIDPADVVAVPTDYNNTKMRVCKYEVLDEIANYQETGDVLADHAIYDYDEDDEYDGDLYDFECEEIA